MKYTAGTIIAACLMLTACASGSQQDDNYAAVNQAATTCSAQLQKENKFITGKRHLAPVMYVNRPFVAAGENAAAPTHYRAIPYFQAAAIDKGAPGSAWRSCMVRNNVKPAAFS